MIEFDRPLGNGSFGIVFEASYRGSRVVAKRSMEAKCRHLAREEAINKKLAAKAPGSPYLAPYLGSVTQDGTKWLVWKHCGTTATLKDYLEKPALGGLPALGAALGVATDADTGGSEPPLAQAVLTAVLRQLLEGWCWGNCTH